MPHPSRIHVVGAAGSGKTTAARLLANLRHVPWYELDVVGYEGGVGRKRSLDERLADLQRIVDQPAWVTEGSFLWWTQALFEAADLIVWLDPSWHVAMPRIVTRHVRASLAGNNRHPGLGKLLKFVWFCRTYYLARQPTVPTDPNQDGPVTRVTVEEFLQPYQDKVFRCRLLAEVDLYNIGSPISAPGPATDACPGRFGLAEA